LRFLEDSYKSSLLHVNLVIDINLLHAIHRLLVHPVALVFLLKVIKLYAVPESELIGLGIFNYWPDVCFVVVI